LKTSAEVQAARLVWFNLIVALPVKQPVRDALINAVDEWGDMLIEVIHASK
jgi:hypothetical protein